jgi:hypothetical protein
MPIRALEDRRVRNVFLKWRDRAAVASPRAADYGWMILRTILNWAMDRRLIGAKPCTGGGQLYKGSPRDMRVSRSSRRDPCKNSPSGHMDC